LNIINKIGRFINGHFTEQLLLQFVIGLCVLIVVLIAFILILLFQKTKRFQRKNFLQKKFNSLLGEIAICESEEELNEVFLNKDHQKLLQQFGKRSFDRNILIAELAETSKKFRGSAMTNIQWLFKKMNLESDLLKNLNNTHWHKKSKAVQQLSSLQQTERIQDIVPLAHHENLLLRTEAQIAIVKLTGFAGLEFLNTASHPISEWQQLRLIQELSGLAYEEIGNTSRWLKSANDSVVNFALQLVEIYREHDFYDEVKSCLTDASSNICKRAVITLSHISNENTMDELINYYPEMSPSVQIEILKILQQQGTKHHLNFLFSVTTHPDNSFKLEASKAILNISPEALEGMIEQTDAFSYPWNVIFPQLKCTRA